MKKYNWQGCYHCPLKNGICEQIGNTKMQVTFTKNRYEDNWGTPTLVTSKGTKKEIKVIVQDDIIYCATDEFDYIDLDMIEIEE